VDQDDEQPTRASLPAQLAGHADTPIGLTLRAAIASIPFVGGSASLLVEARLSRLQSQRVDMLFQRIAELEGRAAGPAQAAQPSEALLEAAVVAAAATPDQERPTAFANILYLEGAGDDHTEVLRRFLTEVLATLSSYEIALLLSHSPGDEHDPNSKFAKRLLALHSNNPEVEDVRQFAIKRLQTFCLVSIDGGRLEVTRIGQHLLSAI